MLNIKMFTTCGVLITDGNNLLICHPTHGSKWDIPKGKRDDHETLVEAAIRELKEETGLVVQPDVLAYLGTKPYKPNKNIALFKHTVLEMPSPGDLICTSHFEIYGHSYPEMDNFAVVSINTALGMVNSDLARVIDSSFN